MRVLGIVLSLAMVCGCEHGTLGGLATPTLTTTVRPTPTCTSCPSPPSITSLSPNSAAVGSSDVTVHIRGTNFITTPQPRTASTFAVWSDGTELLTEAVSDTELAAVVPASLLHNPGVANISVVNGNDQDWPDGWGAGAYPKSNVLTFTVAPATSR